MQMAVAPADLWWSSKGRRSGARSRKYSLPDMNEARSKGRDRGSVMALAAVNALVTWLGNALNVS
jgi:hypothetical protein